MTSLFVLSLLLAEVPVPTEAPANGPIDLESAFNASRKPVSLQDALKLADEKSQDLMAAGVTAVGSAGNCVVSWNGGASTVTLTGVGGTVASLSDLATLLGPQLHVTH